MKLGVAYNIFDGEEMLPHSLRNLRPMVDFICVVYQTTSNFGNENPLLLEKLEMLQMEGLIDKLFAVELFELEILVANRNHFERLPNNIKYCSKLKSIDFWNTPVAFLPDGFFKLKNLEKLDLSNIRFSPKQHQKIVNTFGGIDLKLDPPCDCMD